MRASDSMQSLEEENKIKRSRNDGNNVPSKARSQGSNGRKTYPVAKSLTSTSAIQVLIGK